MFANLPKFVQEIIRTYLASGNFLAAKELYDYYLKAGRLKTLPIPEAHRLNYPT